MIPGIDIFYIFNGKEYISVEQYDKEIKELEKRINKAIDLLEESRENIGLPWYNRQHLIEKTINELRGEDNE